MHSGRMRTIRCIGRLSCHACPLPHMPPCHAWPRYAHPFAMHAPLLPCMPPFVTHALPCGQNDRCLWKHYLSATTVADGNYALMPLLHRHNKTFINHLFLHIFIHYVFVYIFISLIECFAEAFSKSFNNFLRYVAELPLKGSFFCHLPRNYWH